jgi:hypothetical protein
LAFRFCANRFTRFVIPAQAGIQKATTIRNSDRHWDWMVLDPGLRRDDEERSSWVNFYRHRYKLSNDATNG